MLACVPSSQAPPTSSFWGSYTFVCRTVQASGACAVLPSPSNGGGGEGGCGGGLGAAYPFIPQ